MRIPLFHPNASFSSCLRINRRRLVSFVIAIVWLVSLFGVNLSFVTMNRTAIAADNLFYDFISQAYNASWSSGAGSLSFPGTDTDSRGFAMYRDNWQLEDNSTGARVLETHPQWVNGGWIMGKYPQVTVPDGAVLEVTLGFLKGATGSDGVIFKVQFEEGQTIQTILTCVAGYDSKLDTITKSLESLGGKSGRFILFVDSGQGSGQDWAAWIEAKIEMAVPPELPDLVVSDIEQDGDTISYEIENVGEGSAISSEGGKLSICNALFIDGEMVDTDCISVTEIEPGDEMNSDFDYNWEMTTPQHIMRVCADWEQDVEEENEKNNCQEQPWYLEEKLPDLIIEEIICDRENSQIGYVIKNIGEAVAPAGHATILSVDSKAVGKDVIDIDLETGERQESWFDGYSWPECQTTVEVCADDSQEVQESNEQNNCLEKVCEYSEDQLPLDLDGESPSISLLVPDTLSGKPTINAAAIDNIGVDRVKFFLDGKLVFTDFSSPFQWGCDTSILDEGSHSFGAQAFDAAGNMAETAFDRNVLNRFPIDLSPVRVRIISPANRSEVYNEVGILAEISHDNDLRISRIEFVADETMIRETPFDPPISLIPILTPTFIVSCPWDPSTLESGSHNIRVRVQDEAGNWGSAGIVVEVVEPSTPSISVSRDVERIDNYFEVTLTLQNNSDIDITDLNIFDTNVGFQPIGNALLRSVEWGDFGVKECIISNNLSSYWESTLEAYLGTLQQGKNKVLKYYVVPTLVNHPSGRTRSTIGTELVVSFQSYDREYSMHPSLSWSNSALRNSALRAADYLIVTSPKSLFDIHPEAEVNELLSTMAELAKEKIGVLGYIASGTTAEELRQLIKSGGVWSYQLCSDWAEGDGYLLIIGEKDIVPMHNHDFDMTTLGDEPTDYPFTDTSGDDELPDIRVGRIIGDSAANLAIPIRNSILTNQAAAGHYYNAIDVLLVSGIDDNATVQEHFNHVLEEIRDNYFPDACILHWSDYTGANALSNRAQAFKEQARLGKDLIFYDGHGGDDSWCNGLDAWTSSDCPAEPLDLGGNHPVVFSLGCNTGRYWTAREPSGGSGISITRAGQDSIARVFLKSGAAVYIGIVWGLGIFDHSSIGPKFVEFYSSNPSSCIGDVFKGLQADRMSLIGIDAAWRSVVYRYHLYGDPKFGVR